MASMIVWSTAACNRTPGPATEEVVPTPMPELVVTEVYGLANADEQDTGWAGELFERIKDDIGAGLSPKDFDKSTMIAVPAGDAVYGCVAPPRDPHGCMPLHNAKLGPFLIDATEVTAGEYQECVDAHECLPRLPNPHVKESDTPNYPALVTYKQAERYCRWAGKRLPSEHEWERAARGPDGRHYPWGEEAPDSKHANICDKDCEFDWADKSWNDGYPHTAPVRSFAPGNTPEGAWQMAGNVKEWVRSGEFVPNMEPAPPGAYVARGASWYSDQPELEAFYRQEWVPGIRLDDKGFRCAVTEGSDPLASNGALVTQKTATSAPESPPTGEEKKPPASVDKAALDTRANVFGLPEPTPQTPPWQVDLYEHIKDDIDWNLAKKAPDESEMVKFSAGEATFGFAFPPRDIENCLPDHKAYLGAFWIDKTEVTNAEYKKCVDEQQCLPVLPNPHIHNYEDPAYPALMTYKQAERYCRWAGKRLPTEHEWERAARGTDGRRYAWGKEPPTPKRANICGAECDFAWHDMEWDDGEPHMGPAVSFASGRTPEGLWHMSDNLKEWVETAHPMREGDTGEYHYIARGASWYSDAQELDAFYRQVWIPGVRIDDKGVRCAATVGDDPQAAAEFRVTVEPSATGEAPEYAEPAAKATEE
ncbi:MAG: SUMF1/EgtB/PvdO family nonheme iron enzyme [Deltaproteobacteria bacterium]|nr:SUMF1/EgtB/PvdO family nonheme iron enzyme [Deltaproteobacteria bacterium]